MLDPAERSGILRDSLAVGVATGAYGLGFGAVSVASGLSVAQTCVLSLLMFTGASQFEQPTGAIMAAAVVVTVPVVILVLIVAQWYYARRQAAAGVLR